MEVRRVAGQGGGELFQTRWNTNERVELLSGVKLFFFGSGVLLITPLVSLQDQIYRHAGRKGILILWLGDFTRALF